MEYNGEYHYIHVPIHDERCAERVVQRDEQKRLLCAQDGITLVVIPFWWNRKVESVLVTIHNERPDIKLPSTLLKGAPIPTEMPTILVKGITCSRTITNFGSALLSQKSC